MVPAACIRFWAVSPMTKQTDAESIEGKASPRLVLAYRYLGLGPCLTAGECATGSWVRKVVQPPQKGKWKYVVAGSEGRSLSSMGCLRLCAVFPMT